MDTSKNTAATLRTFALAAALLCAPALLASCGAKGGPSVSSASGSQASSSSDAGSQPVSSASSASSALSSSSSASSASSGLASQPAGSSDPAGYTVYSSGRYGYRFHLPSELKQAAGGSESSLSFASSDGKVLCSVSAGNNTDHKSASDYFQSEFYDKQAGITTKQESGNTALIRWSADGKVGYIKCVVGSGSINTIRFQMTQDQTSSYEGKAQYVLSTFETPGVDSTH